MFCSVVIPTIGRATLSRAVHSAIEQAFAAAQFEVIVINDSGQPLPAADWQESTQVSVIDTHRRERSIARNAGAATARGEYLYFLDDDDWLLPNAFEHFWQLARRAPHAVWLHGGIRVVDETGACLAEVNSALNGDCFAQVMGGAWAPLQASLVRASAFFTVGGFDPAILGTEDLDLCRRIALHGDFASSPAAVACLLRGNAWRSSTNYRRAPEDTLRSRENVLAEPHAFARMLASAKSSYWYGRILRVYLSTARYNFRQGRYAAAISRMIFGQASFALAGLHILTRDYWRAAAADHPPNTLHFVMLAAEQQASQASRGAPVSAG